MQSVDGDVSCIYLGLCWALLAYGLSLALVSGGYSLAAVQASHCGGFSYCVAWALECAGFSSLWQISSVALQHVESSQTRNGTHDPCTGRQIPNHWINREVL